MIVKFRNISLVAGLLLALPLTRGVAQIFPPQGDDTTSSMGVFRITVDPAFVPLVAASGASVAYTGYNPVNGKLTSPLCIDSATTIGRSAPQTRFYSFPVAIGAGSWDSVSGYSDYALIPSLWAGAVAPTEEVLTEIKSFILSSVSPGSDGRQCPPDPRIPAVPLAWPMVKAGTFAGVTPRSLGMVQENIVNGPAAPDFPAHSFFDIFVEVNLPPLPGTVSGTAFPVTGAVLYNDSPLVITNLNLTSFPPTVVYIHGETTAVPLKFRTTHAPYWSAGDVFGYLVLAGHGTITNDCSATPAVNQLLDAALGPVGQSRPELAVPWLRTNLLCPTPGTTYASASGVNADGSSVDEIKFPIGALTLHARNFVHGNLTSPITPPASGNTALYNGANTFVSMELSTDGVTWNTAVASGPVQTQIKNVTPLAASMATFDTEMLQLNLSGNSPFGPFMIRESPTKQSTGRHTIQQDPRGYRISSFFDVFLEVSIDGGQTWTPANRSIRVQPSAPLAVPNSIFISKTNNAVVLQWLGDFTLQHGTNVLGPFNDTAGTSPFTVTPSQSREYWRLRQ